MLPTPFINCDPAMMNPDGASVKSMIDSVAGQAIFGFQTNISSKTNTMKKLTASEAGNINGGGLTLN